MSGRLVATDTRLQDAHLPPPSCRAAGRARRALLTLASGGMIGAAFVVVPASIATPAAAVVSRAAVKLPKGFPKSVPLPKGATLLSTASTKLGVELGANVSVKASVSAATHAYAHQLRAAGFKVTVGAITSSGAAIDATGHGWEVETTVEPGKLFHLKAGYCYMGIGVGKD